MPTQLKTPGVYREDIFPTPPPILPTGVPVFLGWTAKGTVNQPQRLTLWTQFAEEFGQRSQGYLASAVQGFFRNGGSSCYVLRLSDVPFLPEPDAQQAFNALSAGLEAIASLEDIDLVCTPDLLHGNWTPDWIERMQTEVLAHCDQAGDRFALLDARNVPAAHAVPLLLQQRQGLTSANGALYAPWVLTEEGKWVPPCGHVAGLYARCDRTVGIHQAPANQVVEDVLDLSCTFSQAQQATLNAPETGAGVNYLRVIPGRGIRVWGARTLSPDPNSRYINVRRLFITVGRWVERNLAGVVFEPNDFRLWVRIERDLTAYLEGLARQGALQGTTPQEAFFVKCDGETNPPEVREAGQVVTEIGLAPTQPNEFIVVRLIHGSTGVTLNR